MNYGRTIRLGDGTDPATMDPSQAAVFQETGIYPDQQMAVYTSQALSQYSSDQVMQAFQSLLDTFHSESDDLMSMTQWFQANASTLSDDGRQEFAQGLHIQTEVVNALQEGLLKFSAVLTGLGYSAQVPNLSGWRSRQTLGAFPVAAVLFVVAIIAIVLGVGWYEYWASQSQQAHEVTEQAKQKVMQQAQANIPALVAAGWTPAQIAAYLKQQQDANKPSVLEQIPWKTIAVAGLGFVAIRTLFG